MDSKKKVLIAIIIIILLSLTIFAFAGSDDEEEGLKEGNKTQQVDKKDNKKNDSKDSEKEKDSTEEEKESEEKKPSSKKDKDSKKDKESKENEGTGETEESKDEAYEKALELVKKAEESLTREDLEAAREAVKAVTQTDTKDLEERLDNVESDIDARELVEALEELVEEAENKDDIDEARNFNEDEKVEEVVSNVNNESLKEELSELYDELSKILDDEEEPTINIEDGLVTNESVVLDVEDDTNVTLYLSKDGEEEVEVNAGEELPNDGTADGVYTLRVVDEAFNESTVTFTIDTVAPTVVEQTQTYNKAKNRIELVTKFSETVKTMGGNNSVVTVNEVKTYYYRTKTVTVEFEDLAGNKNSYTVDIDMTAPEVEVSYSTTELTNQDVTVTITSNEELQELEGWALSDDKKVLTLVVSENVTETEVVVKDLVGNETTTSYVVSNIDKVKPEVVEQTQVYNKAKNRVELTTTFSETVKTMGGNNNIVTTTKVTTYYYRTKTVTVDFEDLAGNKNSYTVDIDMTAPEVEVSYSTTELTNQDVTVTITSNEELQELDGWNLSDDKKVLTLVVSENVEETEVVVKDLVGNETTTSYVVSNIDKVKPEVVEQTQVYNKTKNRVELTTTFSETVKTMGSNNNIVTTTKVTTYYYRTKTVTVDFEDLAGNKNSYTVDIDMTNPEEPADDKVDLPENYLSREEKTNKEGKVDKIIVTIKANEEISVVYKDGKEPGPKEKWTLSDDKKSISKEFGPKEVEDNVEVTVTIKDKIGNEKSITFNVVEEKEETDTTAPTLVKETRTPESTDPTNGNVVVVLEFSEALKDELPENWSFVQDSTTKITRTFTTNGEDSVSVKDLAGNTIETSVSVVVSNIDTTKPSVTGVEEGQSYDNEVTITVTDTNLDTVTLDDVAFTSGSKVTTVGQHKLVATDKAGNSVTVNFTILDKKVSLLENYLSREEKTNKEGKVDKVVVTITAEEEITGFSTKEGPGHKQEIENWIQSDDKKSISKEFGGPEVNANKEVTVTIKDALENETTVTFNVREDVE